MADGLSEGMATATAARGAEAIADDPVRGPRVHPRARLTPHGERFWRDVRRRRMLAVADVTAAAFVSFVVVPRPELAVWALLWLPVWVLAAKVIGLYDRDHRAVRHHTADELPTIAAWGGLGVATLGLFLSVTPVDSLSVDRAVVAWLVVTAAAALLRSLARSIYRQVTSRELTVVIGDGPLAESARRKVELFDDMHLERVEDIHSEQPPERIEAASLRELAARVDRIIVAYEHVDPDWIGPLVGICRDFHSKLSVVSPLRGRASAVPRLSEVADLPVLEYDTWDVSRSTMMIKRAFDVVVSSAAMLVLVPFFPLVAVLIKLESRGPVIFRQVRAGMNGQAFRVYKFRTMDQDAEEQLSSLISIEELAEPMYKLRRDPRVTRVGRFLRRFSIDELPQLLNVLKGEMSLVGPRPEIMTLVERYSPEHRVRLNVPPGMTGPMQVYGRGALTFSERLAVELDYIDNLSLSKDLRILFRTLPAIVRGTGAY